MESVNLEPNPPETGTESIDNSLKNNQTQQKDSNEENDKDKADTPVALSLDPLQTFSLCILDYVIKLVNDYLIVALFGYEYGKFDNAGDYSRVRMSAVKRYGIFPTSNMELNRVATPLFYVYP